MSTALVALAGCAGDGGSGRVRDDGGGVTQDFRKPDADARTVFSAPPVEPPNAMRSASGSPGPAYWQQRVDYSIEAKLDVNAREVSGVERVVYHNNSPQELRFLWWNMEQNLFREDSDGALLSKPNGRFGNRDRVKGGFTIKSVDIAGTPAELKVYDTVARLDLPTPLGPGQTVEVGVSWSFPVPSYGSDRMGISECKDGPVFEIAQWFPSVCAYDDVHGWNTLPYLGQGEFYTDFGDYDVAITVPVGHVVAGGGELRNPQDVLTHDEYERWKQAHESKETVVIRSADEVGKVERKPPVTSDGTATWRFHAANVRTYAWASSAGFIWDGCTTTVTGRNDPTLCQSFYPREAMPAWDSKTKEGGSSQMLKQSIEIYSRMWLPYAYTTATNVNGIVGGMEYPTIVFCSGREDQKGLWGVTTHEIGHNWFPMMVSTNERRHAWMDEGFNTFMNYYAGRERYPEKEPHRGGPERFGREQRKPLAQPIEMPADQVRDGLLGTLEYDKTATGLVLLRETILGHERFDAAFREYCRRWAFKHPYPGDFFRAMEDVAGADLGWFWRGWFYGTGVLDQRVTSVMQGEEDSKKGLAHITFEQAGSGGAAGLVMPVLYRVTFEDGTTEDRRVPVEGFFTSDRFTAVVPTGGRKIREVVVDPDERMPDVDRKNNVWKR